MQFIFKFYWEFPGCSLVRTPEFHCTGPGLHPDWILQALLGGKKKKKKNSAISAQTYFNSIFFVAFSGSSVGLRVTYYS